jgi:hypothetical protein
MGPLGLTAAIVVGSFVAGLTFDMGVNALQNWYDIVYQDAFWANHPVDTPAMRDLSREERDIDRLMRAQDFVTQRESGAPVSR